MEENNFINLLRKNWLGIIILSFVLAAVFIASQYSFIQINAKPAAENTSGEYKYYITKSSDGETSETSSKVPTYKKMVRRGSYTVSTTQNETSHFAFVKAGGFFSTKTINAQLAPEQARTFVGDNPDICMEYIDNQLISYSCNGIMKTLKVHVPASTSQATFVKVVDSSGDVIQGTVKTNEGTVILVNSVEADGGGTPPLLTTLNKDGVGSLNGTYPSELSGSNTYTLAPYKDGFVAIDTSFSSVYYFSSISARPEKISTDRPKDTKISPYLFSTSKDSVMAVFTDQAAYKSEDVHDTKSTGGKSTLVIGNGLETKEMTLPGVFSDMESCGENKACVVNNKHLQVYDISGKKPKLVYSIPNVQDIAVSGDKLIVVTEVNVLEIDANQGSGSVAYSFGDYTYCGIEGDKDGFTLCMISHLKRKVALRLDPGTANTNSIDKKISELQHSKAVKIASIYHNFIAIEPNYGQQVYVPDQKIYTYEPSVVKRMNELLEQDLARIGLDRQTYSISGTL